MNSQNWHQNIAQAKSVLIGFWGFVWAWRHEILVILILCAALLLRIDGFRGNHYSYQSDYNRDYLVAHHIVAYHEFPLTGPDGEFGSAGNSPVYFYLLALPLLIKDDIVFLGLFNVFLQIAALVIMYLLARSIFGKPAGLIATVLFSFGQSFVDQSNFVWAPHIMQPFFLLSLLLLYLAHSHKKYRLLLFGIGVFIFSAILHQSVYTVTPIYLLAIALILRAQRKSLAAYAGAFIMFAASFTALHAPLLFYFIQNQNALPSFVGYSQAFLTVDFSQLLQNFSSRGKIFWNLFLFRYDPASLPPFLLTCFFIITAITIAYLRYSKRGTVCKGILLILLATIIQFFLVAIAVSTSPVAPFPFWYFTPLFGIVILCIACIIDGLIPNKRGFWLIETLVVMLLTFQFSPNLLERLMATTRLAISSPTNFFVPSYAAPPFIAAVRDEITSIKEKGQRLDINFFSVRTYRFGREDPWSNEIFWTPLERYFNTPLVVLDDGAQRDYRPIGDTAYMFVSCGYANDAEKECFTPFLTQFPQYHIQKEIYDYPSIYLARREAL